MKKTQLTTLLLAGLSVNAFADFPYPYSNHSNVRLANAAKASIGSQSSTTKKINSSNYTFYAPALGDRKFGWTGDGWRHMGEDIWESYDFRKKNYDKPVYTVGEGIVISKSYGVSPFGRAFVILHPKAGQNSQDIYSLYLHMYNDSHFSNIKIGQYVAQGDRIGTIGATGAAANVSHLHLELRYFPEWYFGGAATRDIYTRTSEVNATTVASNWVAPRSYSVPNNTNVDKKSIFWVTKHLQKYVDQFGRSVSTADGCKQLLTDAAYYYNFWLPFTVKTNSNSADYNVTFNGGLCRFKKSDYGTPGALVTFNPANGEIAGLSTDASYDAYWIKNTTSYANNIEFSKEEAVGKLAN
ncbi:MAG: M23 family metallopeptidase [Psychrosphaera sp.]|nr:M23 family metallopeptidase [Psychrosphaera sp.]